MTDDDRIDNLTEALQRIMQWSEAYPLDIFPEPDWTRAVAVLKANGLSLDAISAHCMRHAILGVGKIAREALTGQLALDTPHVGNRVVKRTDYKWPGIVIMSGLTLAGERRVVVECTVPEVAGALHVYSPDQLHILKSQT